MLVTLQHNTQSMYPAAAVLASPFQGGLLPFSRTWWTSQVVPASFRQMPVWTHLTGRIQRSGKGTTIVSTCTYACSQRSTLALQKQQARTDCRRRRCKETTDRRRSDRHADHRMEHCQHRPDSTHQPGTSPHNRWRCRSQLLQPSCCRRLLAASIRIYTIRKRFGARGGPILVQTHQSWYFGR